MLVSCWELRIANTDMFDDITFESVSNTTLLGLYNPFSNPNAYPKRKETRFGYALGLEKGLYNPNRVVYDTNSKV